MTEFTALKCPSCGGDLKSTNKPGVFKCDHCGTEHLIKGDQLLEESSRCPVCKRNDKVEKVSSIVTSQTVYSSGTSYQIQTQSALVYGNAVLYGNRPVALPTYSSQMSDLARKLSFPDPEPSPRPLPSFKSNSSLAMIIGIVLLAGSSIFTFLILVGIIGIIGSCVESKTMTSDNVTALFVILFLIFIDSIPAVAGVLLIKYLHPHLKKQSESNNRLIENSRKNIIAANEYRLNAWRWACDRWYKLYYCSRDDCVFIPGENTFSIVTQMRDYLYKIENK